MSTTSTSATGSCPTGARSASSATSSYDALGSFILIPLGTAVVGPLAGQFGVRTTLIVAGSVVQVMNLLVLAQREVWAITSEPGTAPAPA